VPRLRTLTFLPGGATVRVPPGTSLFEAATWAGVAVDSTCGARGTCKKCRIRLADGNLTPTTVDAQAFSDAELAAGWRLACRSVIAADGPATIRLEVPPLATKPKAALFGRGRHVVLSPSLQLRHVALPSGNLDDQASDLERLQRALPDLNLEAPLSLVRTLPQTVKGGGRDVTTVVVGNRLICVQPGDTTATGYGVAIDLGTTTVVAALIEICTGAIVALASALNGQERFGSDVISRISHAMTGAQALRDLRDAALTTLAQLIDELCSDSGVNAASIYSAVITGNATMLHLLVGVDPTALALSPFTPVFRAPIDLAARDLPLPIHPEARVSSLPIIGAYVGADIAAGILSTGIGRNGATSLLIDIGTNGEVVLAADGRIIGTSAPAGPAFEGAEIRCGMRAADGAIEAVTLSDKVELQVLGAGAPRGICGSGLADTVAGLLVVGLLDPSGRLRRREEVLRHPLADSVVEIEGSPAFRLAEGIVVTQQDVRALQFAKAAISTGTHALLAEVGLHAEDLDEVLLAGSFGTYIDPASARAIGLIPPLSLDRVIAVGNSSLEGAKIALLSFREQQVGFALAERVEYIELSGRPDFNELFVSALAFPEPTSQPTSQRADL
jgi:uncharacterized 2Fe-2S/4Fe-4S cluster protein (DUF4445 family)